MAAEFRHMSCQDTLYSSMITFQQDDFQVLEEKFLSGETDKNFI